VSTLSFVGCASRHNLPHRWKPLPWPFYRGAARRRPIDAILQPIPVKPDQYRRLHPTQKTVPLLEYLVRTDTNAGDTVLDNCMGSASTGVACANTGRQFIVIEQEQRFFDIACKRLEEAQQQMGLLLEAA